MKKSTALIAAALAIPLAAWICRAIIVSAATPTADTNLVAYSLLVQASCANDIASAKTLAVQAGLISERSTIIQCGRGSSSICESCQKMGVTTKAEATT